MKCSRHVNMGRLDARLNGGPLAEVDCYKYLGSHLAVDGGCERDVLHRMNQEYKA